MKRLLLGGSLVPLLLLATACTGSDADSEARPAPTGQTAATTTAFADCGTLTTPLAPSPSANTKAAAGSGEPLPALDLPCFTGGTQVSVGALRGPAVINLWASWCGPCRKELPAFQRLSERTAGKLRVVGVSTQTGRSAAQSIGEDFGLRFPTLYDPDNRLRLALGRAVMPITLFVDGEGRIRHRDETGALDDAELADLVRQHLGVAVSS
ncbi:TlpA family protein disulfide reductase [Plantactinospora solaniradicis]|uniref:TlpA family protein disulfide reductase n=1 Tax=Plantactinospora solaniradicis TaxID=1723736 RepID=A0ABW1K2H8_9ACTN